MNMHSLFFAAAFFVAPGTFNADEVLSADQGAQDKITDNIESVERKVGHALKT